MKNILIILIVTTIISSCSSRTNQETDQSTESQHYTEQPSVQYQEQAPQKEQSKTEQMRDPLEGLRHEPITETKRTVNPDGSITEYSTTTDGVNTSTSTKTYTPNTYSRSSDNNKVDFEEAYEYAKKAYRNSDDIDYAQDYLKKAMSAFSNAETKANNIDCSNATWSASDGYSNAKKGYNSDTPEDIEYYAKKAMNNAEEGISYVENCERK